MTQSWFADVFSFPMDLTSPASLALSDRMNGMFSPLEITPEQFKTAYELPIGEHVEKNYKGLSYLSWPFAFRYLKEQFPTLFVAFEESTMGWPVFGQTGCWILRAYLTDGCRRTPALVFPLMDNKHNAVKELDARQVSDNIQRASVKCIATFTGLGLKLYSGEDIPTADDGNVQTAPKLPLQQESKKPAAVSQQDKAPTAASVPATGGAAAPAFNGKEALTAFCKANPLQYAEERTSLVAAKTALESLGLAKGDDLKDAHMLANAIIAMVSAWVKEKGIKITKAAMAQEIATLRSICAEGTTEQAIKGVEVFVAGKL